MKYVFYLYMGVRLALLLVPVLGRLTYKLHEWRAVTTPEWQSLYMVSAVIFLMELYALIIAGKGRWRTFWKMPERGKLSPTVLDSQRSFVEILCAVSAGILVLAFEQDSVLPQWPAKVSLGLAILTTFVYLDVLGGSIKQDKDEGGCQVVELLPGRYALLQILLNVIYWGFLYGLAYSVLAGK